jgi:hypothetical protein
MPLDLQVIRASEFVRLDPRAHLDFEASQQALQALAHACRKRGLGHALLDLRSVPVLVKPRFTPTQLAALVSTFREAGFSREQRLAVLYREDVHGGARNFAFISRMRGMQVQAFAEFERALLWLSDDPSQSEALPGEELIRITRPQRQVTKLPISAITRTKTVTSAPRPVSRTT